MPRHLVRETLVDVQLAHHDGGATVSVLDVASERLLLEVRRDDGQPPWCAFLVAAADEPVEFALIEDLLVIVRAELGLSDPPSDLDARAVFDDGPREREVWVNGCGFRTTLSSPAADDSEQLEFVADSSRLDVEQFGGPGSGSAQVYLGEFGFSRSNEHRDIAVLGLLLTFARRRLDIPRPARQRRISGGDHEPLPWPHPVAVPPEIGRLHALGMHDLVVWCLLDDPSAQVSHDELYPGLTRLLFARRLDNDDHAALVPGSGEVAVVHLGASLGWEARRTYGGVGDFLENRLVPDLLERLADDVAYVREYPEVPSDEGDFAEPPRSWPDGSAMPPELRRLHGAGLVDLDAWRLLHGTHDEWMTRQDPFFPADPDGEWVLFAQRRERGLRASWNRHTGQVATTLWLERPDDASEHVFPDLMTFLAQAVFPDFLARHRRESAAERREEGLSPVAGEGRRG